MQPIQEELQAMIDALVAAKTDAAKFERGNDTAGTRLRKVLHVTRARCMGLRRQVSEAREERGQKQGKVQGEE